MLYAIDECNNKILPEPHMKACCPFCGDIVISKCGEINAWHWAHRRLVECDDWTESDTEWHNNWKQQYPKENCELDLNGRRADIITNNYEVILLNSKSLSLEEVRQREGHFKNMIWIIKVDDIIENFDFFEKKDYLSFRWKHARKYVAYITKPTILDFGDGKLFVLRKMYKKSPCGGWGFFISVDDFFDVRKFNYNRRFYKAIDPKDKWEKYL